MHNSVGSELGRFAKARTRRLTGPSPSPGQIRLLLESRPNRRQARLYHHRRHNHLRQPVKPTLFRNAFRAPSDSGWSNAPRPIFPGSGTSCAGCRRNNIKRYREVGAGVHLPGSSQSRLLRLDGARKQAKNLSGGDNSSRTAKNCIFVVRKGTGLVTI